MAKRKRRSHGRGKPGERTSATGTSRRQMRDERVEPPSRPARSPGSRSLVMRLAAEVEHLEQELAAARARVAALEAHADVDPLTNVLNRRGLERELSRAIAYVKRYRSGAALVYLDLDRFKGVNDRHGHAAGDAMLQAVATVLAGHVRASDLLARLGGDEFVLLLWNCTEADALAKAWALEAAIAAMTARHGGATFSVGVSAGVTMLSPLDRVDEALDRADRAMYVRKAERNRRAAAE